MKPGDFYVSVTDLFAVLLPGAVCTFIGFEVIGGLKSFIPPDHTLAHLIALNGAAGWLAFGAIAYIAGHFIASLGARLDVLYDARRDEHGDRELRNHADALRHRYTTAVSKELATDVAAARQADEEKEAKARVANATGMPGPATYRSRFAWFVDRALVRTAWRSAPSTTGLTNAYKLARITLARKAPALHSEMLRTEADSKFFRSFVVVGALALVLCVLQLGVDIGTIATNYDWPNAKRLAMGAAYLGGVWIVLRLAFARFCELRLKTTELAFQGMIAIAHDRAPAAKADDGDDW